MQKVKYKMIFRFIKKIFIELLRFHGSLTSNHSRCVSLCNELCHPRPTLISLNPDELHCDSFVLSVNTCGASCNTIDDSSG